MKINRRDFVKLGSGAIFAGACFFAPVFSKEPETQNSFNALSSGPQDDPLFHLTGADFKKQIGHFNLFYLPEVQAQMKDKPGMPYNRRTYYKISLIKIF